MQGADTDGNGSVSKQELRDRAMHTRQNYDGSDFERGPRGGVFSQNNLQAMADQISSVTGRQVTPEQLRKQLSGLTARSGDELTDMANHASNLHRQYLMKFGALPTTPTRWSATASCTSSSRGPCVFGLAGQTANVDPLARQERVAVAKR